MNKAEIESCVSDKDGINVIFIDTPELGEDGNGPFIRIYLNDEPIFQNPRYMKEDE